VSGIGCDCAGPVLFSRVDVFVGDARAGFMFDCPVAAVPAYDAAVENDLSISEANAYNRLRRHGRDMADI
jgi:hypothetical protein